jgi:uncharacterized protein
LNSPLSAPFAAAISEKRDRLLEILRDCGRVAVAFSGGVDSTVVAKAAQVACGANAVAVTAVSPSLASGELDEARRLAELIGIRHVVIETHEFADPGYLRNAGDRCYFCKSELYSQLEQNSRIWTLVSGLEAAASANPILKSKIENLKSKIQSPPVLVNGANLDDQGDYRPGMHAAREHAVRSPLIEAGFTKADVRELAREWELPVWDKPASPCLSSRIAYGVEVTPERVRRVDAAEQFLREELGLRELRVRLENHELARIEVPLSALPQLAEAGPRERIVARLRDLGFRYVTLDLEGFRSGSLNAALPIVGEIALPTT